MKWIDARATEGSAGIFCGLAVLLVVLTSTARVEANGRFPAANHVVVSPIDPSEILLRVSFGLLISRDGGKSFRWVCEAALGLSESEDPMYAYASTGSLVSSTYQGVTVSTNRGCSWPKVTSLAGILFVDLTQRQAERERIVALASRFEAREVDGGILYTSQLYETVDDAQTFHPLSTPIDPHLLAYTVDLAPSDPKRIYISATERFNVGVLVTSGDNGSTWTTHKSIPLEEAEHELYIGAIDPINPDRLYVRTNSTMSKPSRLLLSEDGGKTFRTIFRSQATLLGFSLSPDGSKVYVGGPKDGLHVASTTDFAFRKTSEVAVQCITSAAADNRLWVCSSEKSGFILAYSKDEGASFEGKVHFDDIKGPLDCPSTPPFDQCIAGWPALREGLGLAATDDAGVPSDNDAGDAASPPSSSQMLVGHGSSCLVANKHDDDGLRGTLAVSLSAGIAIAVLARKRRRASRT